MKCNVCEREFDPVKEIRYTAKKGTSAFCTDNILRLFRLPTLIAVLEHKDFCGACGAAMDEESVVIKHDAEA